MLQVERKDALKAFQKTKYFTLCECTVIFNRKKGPPKLNGNLRNNMQSGSNSSRKQEFRHERDREFGTEKRPRRSRDPTRSKSSSKPASRNQQKKIVGGKYGKILMVKYKSSQSLSSQMAFSVLFSSHDDLGLSSHIGCFYGQMVAEDPPQNCHDFPCWKHFNLSIKGIMNHVDSSIWQLLHSSAIGKHD